MGSNAMMEVNIHHHMELLPATSVVYCSGCGWNASYERRGDLQKAENLFLEHLNKNQSTYVH